jgi:hypothetical protein
VAKLRELAEPALRTALVTKPTLEVKQRLEALLELLGKNRWIGVSLQSWRAVTVLERQGGDDARQVLEGLAKGEPASRLTQEARAALERLHRRKDSEAK